MKNLLIAASIAFAGYLLLRKPSSASNPANSTSGQPLPTTAEDTDLPASGGALQPAGYEGKILMSPDGIYYVIHVGKKFMSTSSLAINYYKTAYPQFATPVNVTKEIIDQIPAGGYLAPYGNYMYI